MKTKLWLTYALLALSLLAGCTGPLAAPTQTPQSYECDEYTTPLHVNLEMSHAPRLDEMATLTCTVELEKEYEYGYKRFLFWVDIPEAATLVQDSELEWEGPIEPGVPVQLSAPIKFTEEGLWTITCNARLIIVEDVAVYGGIDEVHLTVSEEAGEFYVFGTELPRVIPAEQITPGDVEITPVPGASGSDITQGAQGTVEPPPPLLWPTSTPREP